MSDDGPPRGWCPECDGQSQCAPGTCCGVGAPEAARELHRHLDELQIHARRLGFCCYAAALDPHSPCPWHAEAAAQPPAPIENHHRERADYNAVMNGVAAALNRDGLTWEQIDEVTDACLTYVENHHSVRCPDEMCPCSFVGDNAERDLVKHYLRVHAPITAEDVRAVARAWDQVPVRYDGQGPDVDEFVADCLNRRGER